MQEKSDTFDKQLIIITGPTGVGKSDFAEEIARTIPAEIINADMGQLYEPLSVGTAKPAWRTSSITHHLFDICTQPENYTVVAYRAAVKSLIDDIYARNKLPIIVGGSGFYIKALYFPPTVPFGEVGEGVSSKAEITRMVHKNDDESLWDQLYAIDPVRAQALNKNDHYRLERALAIWHTTGILPSACAPVYNPLMPSTLIVINRDRNELYRRINVRTEHMLGYTDAEQRIMQHHSPWIEEVAALLDTPWEPYILAKKIIGYDDIVRYLRLPVQEQQDRLVRDTLMHTIQQKTRHYAKRQLCFTRMLVRMILASADEICPQKVIQVNAESSFAVSSLIRTLQGR